MESDVQIEDILEHPMYVTQINNPRSILYWKFFSLLEFQILSRLG